MVPQTKPLGAQMSPDSLARHRLYSTRGKHLEHGVHPCRVVRD